MEKAIKLMTTKLIFQCNFIILLKYAGGNDSLAISTTRNYDVNQVLPR
jgi:hypothetical protein